MITVLPKLEARKPESERESDGMREGETGMMHFEDEGRGYEPRNTNRPQKLRKKKKKKRKLDSP